MTTLELRIIKPIIGPNLRLGAVADIIPVGASRGKPAPANLRGLVLPVGSSDIRPLTVPVDPGAYLIRATLPSGEILTQHIDARGTGTIRVDLASQESPQDRLNKQQAADAVFATRMVPSSRPIAGVRSQPDIRAVWLTTTTSEAEFSGWLHSDSKPGDPWARLLFGSLAATGPLASVFADREFGKYEIKRDGLDRPGPPSTPLENLLGGTVSPGSRRHYLALEDATRILGAAALPLPWQSPVGELPIEIVLREPAAGSSFAGSTVQPVVSVGDPEVAGLLGYLGKRDLEAARAVLAQAAEWLFGKRENPIAAAAGGYILLAAGGLRSSPGQWWKDWIANLAHSFTWLPDGSIQLAWLKLNSITPELESEADAAEKVDVVVAGARTLLLRALQSGVPFYSAGARLLVDSLTLVANHEECRGRQGTPEGRITLRALALARWLSRRTDPTQPFTAVRM